MYDVRGDSIRIDYTTWWQRWDLNPRHRNENRNLLHIHLDNVVNEKDVHIVEEVNIHQSSAQQMGQSVIGAIKEVISAQYVGLK